MKRTLWTAAALSLLLVFAGCARNTPGPAAGSAPGSAQSSSQSTPPSSSEPSASEPASHPSVKPDSIPFEEGQLYAAAYLGYQAIDDWDYYADLYLQSEDVPRYIISDGDYYLVIPRYDGMDLELYANDIETGERTLRFETDGCGPFVVQCNVSDIFADATVCLSYQGETVEFSPFLSLENGAPVMGERGLDITKPGATEVGYTEPDPYVGEYMDTENDTPGLFIAQDDDGGYTVQIEIYRLAALKDGAGVLDGSGLSFTATDPNGNPISGVITVDGDTATVTFHDSTWEYLPDGTSFQYTRTQPAED